ncbi:MAG TPA: BON domain-containing protein [Pyrinomonadaceae bacterium]|jgi:hyperosmotically inducible protein|nr:BON domain-containing protein [Pyrinomonadaceae bacterium]
MNTFKSKVLAVAAALLLSASAAVASPASEQASGPEAQLAKKVRKELVTLPWYGVFDNLAYEIDGSTVTLHGQVVQPSTRKDAERRVAKLRGVERVVNNIEVLPLSGFDDDIRARTYRALFGWNSPLFRYGRGVNPSIHIIVNNGRVTLEGVVANEGDRRFAYALANGVSGVFAVTNNLRAESERAR